MPVDEIVQVSLFLYGTSSNLSLNISGKVVRKSDAGTAIKFTELDLDSFIHLRNIVSRNAFDEQKIIKEFQEFKTEDSYRRINRSGTRLFRGACSGLSRPLSGARGPVPTRPGFFHPPDPSIRTTLSSSAVICLCSPPRAMCTAGDDGLSRARVRVHAMRPAVCSMTARGQR